MLEVVEAEDAVDLVPVVDTSLECLVSGQAQIDSFVKQNIEQLQEEVTVGEVARQATHWGYVVLFEDLVYNTEEYFSLLLVRVARLCTGLRCVAD